MLPPLITTKLFVPSGNPEITHRIRLFEQMDRFPGKKLTTICAPAGFGKTTLVVDWIKQRNQSVAWLSLDENDNDLIRFFSYLLRALQQIEADVGQEIIDRLNGNEALNGQTIVTLLINEIASRERQFILVLDDYHQIEATVIHEAITLLLNNIPENFHIIITSRAEPPLQIVKLRARSQATEISALDLRFTNEEINSYLNQIKSLNLDDAEIEQLDQRTEGWIVGLQLVALSISEQKKTSDLIQNFSGNHRYVADYLIDEVLETQSPQIQSFLLKTSILERMCADSCSALLSIDHTQDTLEDLDKSNLFMVRLDNNRGWYRYHHLFGELLQSRLKKKHEEEIPDLYFKAYHWHLKNDFTEEAVRYAITGKYFSEAADIVEKIGFYVYWTNNVKLIHEWLKAFPAELLESRLHLQILKAYVDINVGELRNADQTFKAVNKSIDNTIDVDPGTQQDVRGRVASGQSAINIHYFMNWQSALDNADLALKLLPKDYLFDRCIAAFHGGGALIELGELDQARDYLNNALTLSNLSEYPAARFLIMSYLGDLNYARGQLKQAMAHYKEVSELAYLLDLGTQSPSSSSIVGLATLHYEWNQLDEALDLLEKITSVTESEEFIDRQILSHTAMIRLQCTLENFDEAREYLRRLSLSIENYGGSNEIIRRIDLLRMAIDIEEGNLDKVIQQLNTLFPNPPIEIACQNQAELVVYARGLIIQQRYRPAKELLTSMLNLASAQNRITSVIKLETLIARCHYLEKDSTGGAEHLTIALDLAESEAYIRTFLDEGLPIRNLLSKLQHTDKPKNQSGYSQKYIQTLLGHFARLSESTVPAENANIPTISGETLTPREIDVIRLLAQGLPYAQLADQLQISENTLKYHIKNLYSKLQVNNRMQAVTAARNNGII